MRPTRAVRTLADGYDRFNAMRKSGLLDRIIERLPLRLNEPGLIDPELFCIGGANARAAAGVAGKNPRPMRAPRWRA